MEEEKKDNGLEELIELKRSLAKEENLDQEFLDAIEDEANKEIAYLQDKLKFYEADSEMTWKEEQDMYEDMYEPQKK